MNNQYVVKEFTHASKTVKVFTDPDPSNPRTEYDNRTEISHWHTRYDFGKRIEGGTTEEEMLASAEEQGDPILAILPLYLYDHSGLCVKNTPFGCSWDSGKVGWVYITKSLSDKMGCEGFTQEQYLEAIKADTQTYNSYLTGEVYGYEVLGMEGDQLESCWGFIGDVEYCVSEAKSAAEGCSDPAVCGIS